MLAHELRNPLAPISNALSILKLSEDKAVQKKALATIGRQVEQMVHLVDDLVDVARITQNKIELRKKPVRIDEALKSAIETVRPLLNKKKHLLSVNLPSDAIWVNGDLTRLSQIFANLLTNAAKFTEAGGRIELTARLEGSEVAVIVHDNGIGISPFVLPRIFNMFAQRGQMEPAEDALGIGLSLATTLAKLHGGRISAYSPGLGQGSEFTVRLPVLSEAPVPAAVPETSTLKKSSRRYRMLVVDDNEASAKTLAWTLELMGHDVRVAHDGLRAIEIAESFLPEVILLDIGLPGMNGFELCKSLRRIPRIRNSLYIAQTGWGQEEHKRRSKEVGFDYHLVKPVDIEALQSLLESAHLPA
jgi:CheY-like chemotaxis protein